VSEIDHIRREGSAALNQSERGSLGQFFTSSAVADLMASMLPVAGERVRLLDPGAGVGSLSASAIVHLAQAENPPTEIEVVAYELDATLRGFLDLTFEQGSRLCSERGIKLTATVAIGDFMTAAAEILSDEQPDLFDLAILNPPYYKVRSDSEQRKAISALGFEAPNIYAGFLGAAIKLVRNGGHVVSITPRSFTNGTYFRQFRSFLLDSVAIRRMHVFDSRSRAFKEDEVLQENLILHAQRGDWPGEVTLSASEGPGAAIRMRTVPMSRVVYDGDPERFIHLIVDDAGDAVAEAMARMPHTLAELGLQVSTGPVVDFRVKDLLRDMPGAGTVPLIYPGHFERGRIVWPQPDLGKANALDTGGRHIPRLTVPRADYVLLRRFSAKEERRRVVAAVIEGRDFESPALGLENHLNYFHQRGAGLSAELARGLALYLNSTFVDEYFRQFSGHTQVNASDLRNIRYPSIEQLKGVGSHIGSIAGPDQEAIDELVMLTILKPNIDSSERPEQRSDSAQVSERQPDEITLDVLEQRAAGSIAG
jgi:adenine-specific DNA-methyltransferase